MTVLRDTSDNRSVSAGQLPAYSYETSQHNETSVWIKSIRLGENHGGVKDPWIR